MEELIKEAERLYNRINRTQQVLVKSRLNGDEDGAHYALVGLETIMCATLQLLKCFMERKDNIVDLSKIWKDGKKEKPLPYSDIVVRDCCISSNDEDALGESQWAYLEDLLPKGGEA